MTVDDINIIYWVFLLDCKYYPLEKFSLTEYSPPENSSLPKKLPLRKNSDRENSQDEKYWNWCKYFVWCFYVKGLQPIFFGRGEESFAPFAPGCFWWIFLPPDVFPVVLVRCWLGFLNQVFNSQRFFFLQNFWILIEKVVKIPRYHATFQKILR